MQLIVLKYSGLTAELSELRIMRVANRILATRVMRNFASASCWRVANQRAGNLSGRVAIHIPE